MVDVATRTNLRDCDRIIKDKNRGALIFNRTEILKRPLVFLKILGPFLLSHHPSCSQYENHTFRLRNREFCIGCYFNSIFFFLSFSIIMLVWVFLPTDIDRSFLLYSGVGGLLIYVLIGVLPLRESRKRKIFSKFILGSSFAFILFVILSVGGSIEFMVEEKASIVMLCFIVVMTFLMAKRGLEMTKTCESCEYKMRWSRCPGFGDIVCTLVEQEFVVPKIRTKK